MRTTVLVAVPEAWETAVVDAIAVSPGLELSRRCADLPELLSTAAAGLGVSAVVGRALAGLDRTAIADLGRLGVRVVGVVGAGDEAAERALRAMGVVAVLPADAAADRLAAVLGGAPDPELQAWLGGMGSLVAPSAPPGEQRDGADGRTGGPDRPGEGAPPPGPAWTPAAARAQDRIAAACGQAAQAGPAREPGGPEPGGAEPGGPGVTEQPPRPPGRVVTVWGPAGAPGRSTTALALASEAARLGAATLLIDADPYGGVQAQLLALLDESAGLAGAVRQADQGTLDVAALRARCLRVAPELSVLTGISRADRWPELRPDPLETVLALSRMIAELVVVDVGFCLEDDEELSYDTAAPRRNAATLVSLASADHLVVVAAAEPVGLQRLVRGLQELGAVRTPPSRTVVVNQLRESAVGPDPRATVAAALERFAGLTQVRFVPADPAAFDLAMLHGRTLAECAPGSPARMALADLAAELLGRSAADGARRTGPSRRGRRRPSPRQSPRH
ncbi:MAG: hypothetical protein LCH98_11135 [Actinobacteria bacterium]|nr:hypothetical protein [Actinomycetota bacterium]